MLTKAPTSEAPAAEASPSGITILVAEDDVIVRTLIASVLRAEGYRALLSADGAQAIELFDRHADEISIVVLDVIMPRKSGREVAEYVWNLKPQMPILFTSGYFTDGMDPAKLPPAPDQAQILRKPYGRQELIDRLRQIVSSQGAPPSVA